MGIFSKENCCLCGGKTGLLDKKSASGKVCKECRGKLSVWFDAYKESTADDLRAQLSRKEADLERIKTLNFKKAFGEFGVILIDEDARVFTALPDTANGLFAQRKSVTSIDEVMDKRPDLIGFDQIKDIEIDITENAREEKRTVDGQQQSYDPPRYTYLESFTLNITLDHPYIRTIRVPLCNGTVQIKNEGRRLKSDLGKKLAAYMLDMPHLITENVSAVYDNDSLADLVYHSAYEMPAYSYGFKCSRENWDSIRSYQYYICMGHEIERILLG